MASGTLISRALGLVRVMLIAFILGNGTRQADMLALATMVPNSLYILFAGGALNTVLVPQIVRAIKHDPDGGEAYTNRIMTAFMLIVAAVAMVVTIAAPVVTSIYSSSEWRTPELAAQYGSMVALTYLTLPQIFFYGAFFLLGQVLNARDRFGPMMWAPIANNVISVLVLSTYFLVFGNDGDRGTAFTTPQLLLLGIGSTVGIAAQTAVLIPYLRKVGFSFRPRLDLRGTGLGKTFSLTKWTMGFVAVNQLALMVITRLGTSATAAGAGGGVDVYSKAHLIWILPHSLITVSLATAMLPNASRLAAAGDMDSVALESTRTTRLALIAIVPAAVGFFTLAGPIADLLFGHGQGSSDSQWVAWALMGFAVGLVPFTVQFICLRTFYALENTRTPFLLQLVIAGLNAGLAILFVWLVGDPSWVAAMLALAYSVAYLTGVLFSWRALSRRLPALDGRSMLLHVVRLVLGASLGGVVAYFLARWVADSLEGGIIGNLLGILAGLAVIGGVYVGVAKLLKVRELRSLSELVRTRLGRRGSAAQPATVTGHDASSVEETRVNPVVREDAVMADDDPADFDDEELSQSTRLNPVVPAASMGPAQRVEEPRTEDLIGEPGMLLSTRFRADQLMVVRFGVETWRAHDLVLSRDVVAHIMKAGDPRIDEVLHSARKGAVATDSRFLRVLDAMPTPDHELGIGAYIVCEYAAGCTLTEILSAGPLSALEAGWITRELADALTSLHAQGLYHEHLNPDNVIITPTGAVRLVGFGVDSALIRHEDHPLSWGEREKRDVIGLGQLLYATLVHRWPGEAAYGMEAAPIIAGEPASPHIVRAGVSPALDRIATVTLTQRGAAGESRIQTIGDLARALDTVLGSADASLDLEHRVRALGVTPRRGEPVPTAGPALAHEAAFPTQPRTFDSAGYSPIPAPLATPSEHDDMHRRQERRRPVDVEAIGADPLREDEKRGSGRGLMWLILALAVGTLVIALIIVGANSARDNATPGTRGSATATATPEPTDTTPEEGTETSAPSSETPSETPAGEPQEVPVVGVVDFDPEADGGNAEENTDALGRITDDDPSSGWPTLRYHNRPDLGGLKPGIGVVLDLGEPRAVSTVQVLFEDAGTTVELRVPAEAGATSAPMGSQSDWEAVATQEDAPAETTFTLEQPRETQFLLLYLTSLPQVETARYRTQINDVTVNALVTE